MSAESHKGIDEAAGDWFARRESGEWTAEDQAQLDDWLNASPLHRVAYLRIEHAWERAERLKALATGDRRRVPPPGQWVLSPFFDSEKSRGRPVAASRSRLRTTGLSLAAGLAAAFAIGGAWLWWPAPSSYRTPIGGMETVPLADGSTVTLNTDSIIQLDLSRHERRVELRRGEAFFEVAKDPARPFVVVVGDKRVVAVGTQFSVRRDGGDGDVQVVVTEGIVRMEGRDAPPQVGLGQAGSGALLLPAGTVARASGTNVMLQKEPVPAAEEALSWRQGVLVFHDLTLAQAVAEFNRYNTRQIVIEDPQVASLTVAGSFRANNVDAFVRLLEKGYPVRSEIHDDQLILAGR